MRFTKMNGAGNDFILLDAIAEPFDESAAPALARALCDRRRSVGADGLMLVTRAEGDADYRMRFYNSDGSLGEMCGNGARCICRYGYENGLAGETQRVETTAGLVTGWRMGKRLYRIRLNDPCHMRLDGRLEVGGITYDCAYVELGDPGIPHAAVPIAGLRDYDAAALLRLGRTLRHYPDFPKGANVNFYEITGEDCLYERTFERGVEDFTYACGTGTGASVYALAEKRRCGDHAEVEVKGGLLIVDIVRDGKKCRDLLLTGPASMVCTGEIFDEAISQ